MITKIIDLIPGEVLPLAVIDAEKLSEKKFWSDFVCKHQPIIIKGGVKHWPACQKWRREGYLESITDNRKIFFKRSFNPHPYLPSMEEMGLQDALNEIQKLPDDRTFSIPSIQVPEKWEADFGEFPFLTARVKKRPVYYPLNRIFIYKNASTDWHSHPIDETIASQLVGSKRISLFKCTEKDYHHYAPYIEANAHHSPVAEHYFSSAPKLVKYEGILEQGDSIYIPPFWWHGLDSHNTDFGITLAHCFRSPLHRFGSFKEPTVYKYKKNMNIFQRLLLNSALALSALTRKIKGEEW